MILASALIHGKDRKLGFLVKNDSAFVFVDDDGSDYHVAVIGSQVTNIQYRTFVDLSPSEVRSILSQADSIIRDSCDGSKRAEIVRSGLSAIMRKLGGE